MEQRCSRIQTIAKENESANEADTVNNELLQRAMEERDRFLDNNPTLKSYQKEIDRLLDNSGNQQGRMAVLGTMMQAKLMELQKELCSLNAALISKTSSEKNV